MDHLINHPPSALSTYDNGEVNDWLYVWDDELGNSLSTMREVCEIKILSCGEDIWWMMDRADWLVIRKVGVASLLL